MLLRDDVDVSRINWTNQASVIRRYAEQLPPAQGETLKSIGRWRANSHSADLLFQTQMG